MVSSTVEVVRDQKTQHKKPSENINVTKVTLGYFTTK